MVAPKPGQRSSVPIKPKPAVPQKPKHKLIDDEPPKENLFAEENETDVFGKDSKLVKDVSDVDLFSLTTDTSAGADGVDADDILKYIQANEKRKDDDLDLFS